MNNPTSSELASYWNSSKPVEERVSDLLSRMSLEEKVGQMVQAERASVTPDDELIIIPADSKDNLRFHFLINFLPFRIKHQEPSLLPLRTTIHIPACLKQRTTFLNQDLSEAGIHIPISEAFQQKERLGLSAPSNAALPSNPNN
ncbi:hypothetical protein [Paenibacillus sp. BAC0078]